MKRRLAALLLMAGVFWWLARDDMKRRAACADVGVTVVQGPRGRLFCLSRDQASDVLECRPDSPPACW
jgi:hypothetical protein